ncbi:hypothetical protein EAX62_16120 [Tessaracoccus antarcticus]|uniref:Uncharacterized protein n=1 Tax=Tessaracoccus antarcticus TaxID=2479848 RepID=A0A3M0FX45_9ACTN|nr:hypothetical protein EAX62_16120 [Tessaracoccus antarcticus]
MGLASIGNDDTNFAFGTDQAVLEIENGELFLLVDAALAGDSTLSRFSYQVVLTVLQSKAAVTGTITWPTNWFRPVSGESAALAGVFQIVLNRRSEIPLQGPLGGVREVLEPLRAGEISGLTVGTETCQARYRILRPPLVTPLKVTVTTEALHGPGSIAIVPIVPDLDRVFVTLENPGKDGIDFYAKWYKEPA